MAKTLEQMIADEKPEIVEEAQKEADRLLLDIHLKELRSRMDMTQNDVAKALSIKQPTVSEIEKPGRDIKLSTLKRYIEAGGGKLRLDVELPDGTHYGFSL